jgi:deazaflavin-dependent oxidoreductase (nitroreductase family)
MKSMSWMSDVMFRRGMKVQGRPLLRLTTVGAKTGKERRAILGWFEDGDRQDSWIVVASAAGSVRHPDWAHNLAKNPDRATVELGHRTVPVTAELIEGPEREVVWERIATLAPGYGKYTAKTDRELPVFRLTARPS